MLATITLLKYKTLVFDEVYTLFHFNIINSSEYGHSSPGI